MLLLQILLQLMVVLSNTITTIEVIVLQAWNCFRISYSLYFDPTTCCFVKCEKIYISGCGWGFFWIFCRSDEKQSENSVFSNLCLEGFSDVLKPTSVLSWNEKNMLEELPSKGKRMCILIQTSIETKLL